MVECSKSPWNLLKKQQVRSECAADLTKANCLLQETFSARRTSPAFLFAKKEKPLYSPRTFRENGSGYDLMNKKNPSNGQAHQYFLLVRFLRFLGIHSGIRKGRTFQFLKWRLFLFPEAIEQFRNEVKSLNTQIIAIATRKAALARQTTLREPGDWAGAGRKEVLLIERGPARQPDHQPWATPSRTSCPLPCPTQWAVS